MNMETELFIGGNSNFVIILLFNNFKDLLNFLFSLIFMHLPVLRSLFSPSLHFLTHLPVIALISFPSGQSLFLFILI